MLKLLIPFAFISQCKSGSQGLNPWSLSGNKFIVVVFFSSFHRSSLLCTPALLLPGTFDSVSDTMPWFFLLHKKEQTSSYLLKYVQYFLLTSFARYMFLQSKAFCAVKLSHLTMYKNKQTGFYIYVCVVLLRQGLVHHNACACSSVWLHDGMWTFQMSFKDCANSVVYCFSKQFSKYCNHFMITMIGLL